MNSFPFLLKLFGVGLLGVEFCFLPVLAAPGGGRYEGGGGGGGGVGLLGVGGGPYSSGG